MTFPEIEKPAGGNRTGFSILDPNGHNSEGRTDETYQTLSSGTIDVSADPLHSRDPYLEISPYEADGGEKIVTNPSSLSKRDLKALGHPESYPKAIRVKCIDCCGGQPSEVRKCTALGCPLWPLRMGKNPFDARAKRLGGGS